ncbi:hypothetical protein SAMN05192588_1410 [Nonlabens sp. Hel1_33_55]|uniref:hypothetical protein n=1 Tax=Nonlabens sp. Hel1_33_55 TaxID=1336802 RepID=UPI000875CA16|nr:hypothetical protein [Nonlabens sp. Hel1_33_55]SCY15403.1 hypothetical protein SAMN05192588_1410 [Nonlabens sp. Hel1_33_55]
MNAFVGKSHYLGIVLFLLGIAFAKAQSTTTTSQNGIQEITITSKDDRTSLFKKINMIKQDYGISTTFKDYELGRMGLTTIELEFTSSNGSKTIKASDPSGISGQVLRIDTSTNNLVYAGVMESNSINQATANVTADKPKVIATKPAQTSTYSIKSETVTDPDALDKSQVDMSGPKEITAAEKAKQDAEKERVAQQQLAAQKAQALKEELARVEVAARERAAQEKLDQEAAAMEAQQQLAAQKAQALKEEQARIEVAAREKAAQEKLDKEAAAMQAQQQLAAQKAQALKDEQARVEVAAIEKAAQEKLDKESASMEAQQQLAAQKAEALKLEQQMKDTAAKEKVAKEAQQQLEILKGKDLEANLAQNEMIIEDEVSLQNIADAAERELENNLVVPNKKKMSAEASTAFKEKQQLAAVQDDDASMKQTIAELKRIQEKEARKVKKSDVKDQGYVFINAQQYNYEVYKNRSLIYDATERTVLVLPTELDGRAVTGTTTINGLRYKFNFKNNIITLQNGAGELVDLEGNLL